jgi:2-methylisocitrate lyase-like PEP mutase family enzyme
VIEYGDEWGPIIGRGPSIAPRMAELAQLAAEAGRAPIPVSIFSLGASDARLVEEYQAAGASRFIFGLPAASADRVLPTLERYANIARTFQESVPA